MEKILQTPLLYLFSVGNHLEFHDLSYNVCDKYKTLIDAPPLLTGYQGALTQEWNVFRWLRKSEYTEKKAETDHDRDRTFRTLRGITRENRHHFDPATRDHAEHVYLLIESYGNLPLANYDAETAEIDSLITRLNSGAYAPSVLALGLKLLVDELQRLNDLFKTFVDDAAMEQVTKPDISALAARRATDAALKKITDRATALITLNGDTDWRGFIDEYNVLVNHYNTLVHEHYGRLHARVDIAPAVIDPIPVQPYTGTPVYVIPKMTLTYQREGVEKTVDLLFTQDFTVAYQNNLNPGTASLIIKGIGKYTGELVTTFNIARQL
jgi:hypothetical protein